MNRSKAEGQWGQCTCLRLRKLTRRVTQMYDQALAPADLTSSQFSILAYLSVKGDVSIGTLAEQLLMDPKSLTRTLQPLEKRKLIKVAVAKDDRRRRSIVATEVGRAAFRAAVPLWRKAQSDLADLMGSPGIDLLNRSLDASLLQLTDGQP